MTKTVRLSDLCHDYLERLKETEEHRTMDSVMRSVLREADDDWVAKARDWREQQDSQDSDSNDSEA
jgi:Arc/MetJ-type ribon-helix-helix transcriptional regulator